MLLRRVRH
jgi:hypothetical protein